MRAPAIRILRRLRRDSGGAAAVEFALIVGSLIFVLLNAVDIARYYYLRSAVETATQMAAQNAWKTCDTSKVPATINCTGLTASITASLQASQLGGNLTLVSGSPTEGYYCVNSSGVLTFMNAVTSAKPSDCSAAGVAANKPGDYIKVQSTYTYSALFPTSMAAKSLPTPLTATALMRLQ